MLRSRWLSALALIVGAACACAAAPDSAAFRARQTELLGASLQRLPSWAPAKRRIYYLGLAMYSERWSENDAVDFATALAGAAPGDEVVPVILSNMLGSLPERYPAATVEAVGQAVQAIATRARADDLIVVFASTHGSPGAIVDRVDGAPPELIGGETLERSLAPLGPHKTMIVLSACYAGSLIQPLRAPNRIIVTAARADRTSFGCQADASHTVFGEAMLDAFHTRGKSLEAMLRAMRDEVAEIERQRHYGPPSDPRVFVGSQMTEFYRQPGF